MKSTSAVAPRIEIPRKARKAPSGLDGMSLTASHGASKNQCVDKRFSRLTGRRVRERQFALSCPPRPPRSLVFCAHFPSLRLPRSRSGLRQNSFLVMRWLPRVTNPRTGWPVVFSAWNTLTNCDVCAPGLQTDLSVRARPHARQRGKLPAKEACVCYEMRRVHPARRRAMA